MTAIPKSHDTKRRWQRLAACALGAVPVILVVAWLAFHHKPAWYHPAALDEAGLQRAKRQAINTADFISDRMVEGAPFEVVLQERMVNEWLAALPRVWPDAHQAIPREVRQPAVHFGDGVVRVGFHYQKDDWQAILSVAVKVDVIEDQRSLLLKITDARSGSLPLPDTLLDRLLLALRSSDDHQDDTRRHRAATALRGVTSSDDLEAGITLANRFIWPNGQRSFLIESLTSRPGELRLSIRPR